jgi:hypothetical protein
MGKPTAPEPGDLYAARRLTDALADRAESAGVDGQDRRGDLA